MGSTPIGTIYTRGRTSIDCRARAQLIYADLEAVITEYAQDGIKDIEAFLAGVDVASESGLNSEEVLAVA